MSPGLLLPGLWWEHFLGFSDVQLLQIALDSLAANLATKIELLAPLSPGEVGTEGSQHGAGAGAGAGKKLSFF